MIEMAGLLIASIISLPILIGVVLFFIDADSRKSLLLILSVCLLLGIFLLNRFGEVDIISPFSFMGERITFSTSNTALLIFFASLLVLTGIQLKPSDDKNHISGFKGLLLCFSLSFGFIAFISGQFMVRYIALDIVGLIAALLVIKGFNNPKAFTSFYVIFAILRLGDLSLLASILLLYSFAGTLNISEMITASASLPLNMRLWVFGGFFAAVLVKTAVWPFLLWMRYAKHGTKQEKFWASGMLMPALGYYLLYRIQPLIVSNDLLIDLVVFVSGGLIILMILLDFLNRQSFDRFSLMNGLWSCFIFTATALGPKNYLKYLIAGFLIYRFLLYLQKNSFSFRMRKFVNLLPSIIITAYVGVGYSQIPLPYIIGLTAFTLLIVIWDLMRQQYQRFDHLNSEGTKAVINVKSGNWIEAGAVWLNKNLEIEIFTNGIYTIGLAFKETATWLNEKVEIGVFTNGFYQLSDALEGLAGWLSDSVEQGMEKVWSWISKTLMRISEVTFIKFEVESSQKSTVLLDNALTSLDKYEQNVLRKNLRLDLAWIPLLLLMIFVLILVV